MSREIQTSRLRLRPITGADLDAIHRLWIDPGVRRYLWDDEVIPIDQAASAIETSQSLFEANGYGLWIVCPRDEETVIGFCGYWFFHDPPELELLYGIATTEWNKAFATEAAIAMIKYGFEELSFNRIQASTDEANQASVRVMEKAGMIFDKRDLTNGLDTIYYSITREAFQQTTSSK
ncbi:MAG TPA: GNAT family N-acetyltransferase [Blastocatellia bacterium]|nr:GNAT family N-acetyltransferase [Blastocatellia bacterium]